jgi:hypothetical protein
LRAEAKIGSDARKIEWPAAIDDHGHLRIEPLRERSSRQRAAQRGGKHRGIKNFFGIESGQRIAQNRHAIRGGYAERGDLVGEFRGGAGVQAAYLDAASRSDLDDAVAMATRRRTQSGKRVERNSADGNEPQQQAVAGRQWPRQTRTDAAPLGKTVVRRRGHVIASAAASARSFARAASTSLRRGCQKPHRRAASNRAAIAAAAAGFSRSRKSRTAASST